MLNHKLIVIFLLVVVDSVIGYPYKIAFVKQVVYQDLYCASQNSSTSDLIFSSFKRSGPVALFTRLNADFYIVDTEPDSECNIWKKKTHGNTAPYELLRTEITGRGLIAGHKQPQGSYAVKVSDIDWGRYDIVITMECAVPARITKKYPSTLWAYYIGEGGPSFQRSLKFPVAGYDCFLNQNFAVNPQHEPHVIEFPYQLHYYGCFHELFGKTLRVEDRKGIYFEYHTGLLHLSEDQKRRLNLITPELNKSGEKYNSLVSLKSMIRDLLKTKYFIIYLVRGAGKRSLLRGNAIPEAIATGNLVIARDVGLQNKSLFTKKTLVANFDELINRIEYFEKHPQEYLIEVEGQRKNLNYYCYERPVQDLFRMCSMKKSSQK